MNLNHVVFVDIREHVLKKGTYVLWGYITQARIGDKTTEMAAWSLGMGDREHCENLKTQVEKVLADHDSLVQLEGPEAFYAEEDDDDEDEDEEVVAAETPVPQWFRNLPADEGDDWAWD